MQLRQPEHEHQRRHEEDAAADAEEPGEHAAARADQHDERDRHTRSRTPTAARSTAKPYESRCDRDPLLQRVPTSTPNTAGMPTSAAAPTLTSPWKP